MPAEKSFRLFPTAHHNAFKDLYLASSFTFSQRLAEAPQRLVFRRWSNRSIKVIRY